MLDVSRHLSPFAVSALTPAPVSRRVASHRIQGFTLHRRTWACVHTIIRVVELGLHSIVEGAHGFIGVLQLHPIPPLPGLLGEAP
ncbi:hypothetical protein B9Q03_11215 [Candidatus Marsarchaeota G2 archaeon OSP_D]|uniref:Uncharacterized protein n=1 Tax=Candidatus Marsarchaeota G2 archaeon OSP_D TaxID=1978157 RepID=A0A2R6AKY8_9ARCH|nr:MAG: hypothetical protein B9Q03_11215 [Candidatus Marsarchaeota G2 archaeon OSP_D]